MIILFLLLILLFLIFNIKTEKFEEDYIPEFITIYKEKLERFKKNESLKILLIGSISQRKLDFFTNYFDNVLFYVYNEDRTEYKNISDNIIQNDFYPYTSEEVLKFKNSHKYFDIIMTQGQVSIDNFIFIANSYINLLNDKGIILFENVQSIENCSKIIDNIPLNIKNKIEIIDLRRVNGKYDNICLIMDKK